MTAESQNQINCAYIFYTSKDPKIVSFGITADNVDSLCDSTHGVIRTKGVICKDDNTIDITSRGGERLGINSLEFSAGVKVYAIAVATAGYTQREDTLLMYTELTNPATVPAGTNIIVTVKY